MHILVIHQYFLMPGRAGGSRFNEFCRLWSDAGHKVTVLAGTVDHSSGEQPAQYRGRLFVHEREGAVEVVRCWVPPSYAKGYGGRMLGFAGFALSSALGSAAVRDVDVVVASSPPLTTALAGWFAAHLFRRPVPWIFEMRDLWPESAVTTGVLRASSPLTRALYALERAACLSAERVNVLTPAFRDDLLRRRLAPDAKIVFIPNGADLSLFSPGPRHNEARRRLGFGDRFVVLYGGAHGRANALMQLVEAAERLASHPEILIALVGDGPERPRIEAEIARRGLQNIRSYGPQPKEAMPELVNACDVGAAVLQDNPTFRTVYPNKVFDYMACMRPSLVAIDGVARELVCDQARAGVFARPEDPDDLARVILELARSPEACAEMGARGRQWVQDNATRESLAARYLAVMEALVRR